MERKEKETSDGDINFKRGLTTRGASVCPIKTLAATLVFWLLVVMIIAITVINI